MNPKILVLVVSSDTYPSKRNKKIIDKTWVKNVPQNTKVYFYKAGNQTKLINNNQIVLKVGKSTRDISKKNLLAFEYVLNNFDFDFLFRTTTTSYVNLENLNNYILKINNRSEYLYCGKFMKTNDLEGNVCEFVSGAGILFNKKVIEQIVQHNEKLDLRLWDDVGIGKLLGELGVPRTKGNRSDIKGNIFKNKTNLNEYHYRCRIDNHYGYPRFLELYVIKYLDRYIKGIKVNKNVEKIFNIIFEISRILYIQYPILKLFDLVKKIMKYILPNNTFQFLKLKLNNINKKIQLKYFKY